MDLKKLRISDKHKRMIRDGCPKGQRSNALFGVERDLVKNGYSDETICAILLDPAYGLSEKPRENGHAWLLLDIKRARCKPDNPHAGSSQSPSPPKPISAKTLINKELPPLRWAIPGLLPEGLVILAGAPKLGKSWLALDLSVSIAEGMAALGQFPTEGGGVLYIALEDSERRLQTRLLQRLDGKNPPADLHFETAWPPAHQGGLDHLDEWLKQNLGVKLVIIDTLARMRPPSKRGGNVYQED